MLNRRYTTILNSWLNSDVRKQQLLAEDYYFGKQDILHRERTMIGPSGQSETVTNVPNNKLVDNQYKKLVDQKTNYALGKPITIATANDGYLKELHKIFNKKMFRKIRLLGQHAVNGGIAWLYPYFDKDGFYVKVFPSYEICPIWKDNSHDELEAVMRYYPEAMVDDNGSIIKRNRIDLFTLEGVTHYYSNGQSFVLDESIGHRGYLKLGNTEYAWNKLPIIPFRYNQDEQPLINSVKSLQDSLNKVLSDFQNNMEEDPRTSILVLKNYDGTDLASFRHNLATYGVVKVHTVDGVSGGVDVLRIEVNAQNYQSILMQLKRAIVENGRGFDAKEERMDGDPNQMNIESMYTDIDLDVNGMETEFQAGFEELIWFINQYLLQVKKVDYSDEDVEFVFNRDIFINEGALIDDCVKSVGIISNKTIISKHPWVENLAKELGELEDQKRQEEDSMSDAFENVDNTQQQP